jgi:hypothetical protein
MKFGIFMAPFHRVGENPTLAFERDMQLIEWLDELGYDEAFIGEHHSAGWEIISSPEIFMAVAATRTKRIMLGSGVVSVPTTIHSTSPIASRCSISLRTAASFSAAVLAHCRATPTCSVSKPPRSAIAWSRDCKQ